MIICNNTLPFLYSCAYYALSIAKNHHRGEAVIFSYAHQKAIQEINQVAHALEIAGFDTELSVMFQPIVDIQKNKTVGFEALARWKTPDLGVVRPDIFISTAEKSGIISWLTPILLQKALNATSSWDDDVFLSFNLSIYDLSSPEVVLKLVKLVENSDFSNNKIVFEVTETAVMQDFGQVNEALELLKSNGAKIALDDFGTGYSSLSYIQRMPLDKLKIDRSFIIDIATDKNSRSIVKTIFDLCNNLDLSCIVEGVEDDAQVIILKEIGCQYIQGYYFSKPLNQEDVLDFNLASVENIANISTYSI